MAPQDEIDRLRAERDEWRRRAEVAEAVAAERLARVETAERAMHATESARGRGTSVPAARSAGVAGPDDPGAEPAGGRPPRPATLRERWRRYTETIN